MNIESHVISAKNIGWEDQLGDGTYDYYFFPTSKYSESDVISLFTEVEKTTSKGYPYTAYEYNGKTYYEIIHTIDTVHESYL
ncbi:hypothetical protein GIY09_10750 [Aerococcaceae bacterium WS4759]|uniref:Uncharacterized protein n=1 Tax=Fundicoccus ignavus TaxID=2664442 RepID=A0A6I2H127_9LACT|nr:hypothetical protein [Fundicoccus ignavus]MRI86323.1 hypothetical protein [Fundicoccus ignavus]